MGNRGAGDPLDGDQQLSDWDESTEDLVGLKIARLRELLRQPPTDPNWTGPTLGAQPGTFELADLLRFARDLEPLS